MKSYVDRLAISGLIVSFAALAVGVVAKYYALREAARADMRRIDSAISDVQRELERI